MKKYQALVYSLVLLSSIGCKTYNYAPLPDENPMFTEKGQLAAQASANIRFYQGQVAYSPLQGIGLTYGFSGVWKGSGTGHSHGLGLQLYGPFKAQGKLHFSVGYGYSIGNLTNSLIQNGRGEFYYGRNEQTFHSKYDAHAASFGLYWTLRNENTQLGFYGDIRTARYSELYYTRRELDNDPLGYDIDLINEGEIINKTISSLSFSIKATGENGLFYTKQSIGFRTCDTYLYLNNTDPNAYRPTYRAPFFVPYVILNIHIGMNIDRLYRSKP